MTRFLDRFRELASDYDVVLSDVWGVIHNGVEAFPEACAALQTFRENGGTVVMITNAPRPSAPVVAYLRGLNIKDATYDAIVSSGDVTRHYITKHAGQKPYYLGPERDRVIYDELGIPFVALDEADYIIDVGLVHEDNETPENYRDLLARAAARKLPMICANPDLVVERGDKLLYCAGALAELYRTLGGEVIFAGKPHRPIYEDALEIALERRKAAGKTGSAARARHRRLRAHRSRRRQCVRHPLPVRDLRHSCRRFRHARQSRRSSPRPPARHGVQAADRGDAALELVNHIVRAGLVATSPLG